MKKVFYFAVLGWILFEIANVYFIMPFPGSQEMNSIGLVYFLHTFCWIFRGVFAILIIWSVTKIIKSSKILPALSVVVLLGIIYATNFVMAADSMFLQPKKLILASASENAVDSDRIVLGVSLNNQAKAYPMQFLGYHHQVFDSVGGKPIIVTYCTVCRTGRVFEPIVNGKLETFRLVGMDHFNAMFEDAATKSWWRQATGEAIAGKLKGTFLPEVPSKQMRLKNWLTLYPSSLIMQADANFKSEYDSMSNYEAGRRNGKLTRRDSISWQKKSWVLGVKSGDKYKAYDWNVLEDEYITYDVIDAKPIVLVLLNDKKTFAALECIDKNQKFSLVGDSLSDGKYKYNILGESNNAKAPRLKNLNAYQEYWHSWETFHEQ